MEGCNNEKRVRDDSDDSQANVPVAKIPRVGSADLDLVDDVETDESTLDSSEAKAIQDDLLDIFDESDTVTDRDSAIQGLDWVIKSFEEEIHVPDTIQPATEATSDPNDSRPELGYLLEASDDELGLPPTNESSNESKIEAFDFEALSAAGAVGLDGILGFEDEIPTYDAFDFGISADSGGISNDNYILNGDFVTLGGLFDYPDYTTEFVSRAESLSAQ